MKFRTSKNMVYHIWQEKLPAEDFIFSAGGGFLFGAVAGYAIKKVMKIAAVVHLSVNSFDRPTFRPGRTLPWATSRFDIYVVHVRIL
jgi:hypothetical protein